MRSNDRLTRRNIPATRVAFASVALLLGACGGEGSAGSTPNSGVVPAPTPTPTPTPTPSPTPTPTPTPTPPASALACTKVVANPASLSPYSDTAFKTALDNTLRLQFPVSSGACLTSNEIIALNIAQNNWFRDAQGRMAFAFQSGVHDSDPGVTTRLELRGVSFSGSATDKRYTGRLRFMSPTGEADNFTIAQIYGESGGKPILRIERIKSRGGLQDHIWAIYRTGNGDGQASYQDLGAQPATGTPFDLDMRYNFGGGIQVTVSTASQPFNFTDSFSFWNDSSKTVYFKTGCYLQSAGSCDVRFDSLTFDR